MSAGVIFAAFGVAFLAASLQLEIGSARQMGAGYFPVFISALLVVLGLTQIIQGLRSNRTPAGRAVSGPPRGTPVGRAVLGPPRGPDKVRATVTLGFVLGGLALFAFTLETLGLVVATILLVVTAGVVAQGRRWNEVGITAAILALVSALVFVRLLGVQMPLWPGGW